MVEIEPFRGIVYNQRRVPLARVVAPPYDVISPLEQRNFYRAHPANIIRLILGKKYPGDNLYYNRYKRAEVYYKKWLRAGILVLDNKPSIYILKIVYKEEGKKKTRVGFISLGCLESRGKNNLLPHERTFSGPKKDRFLLLRRTRANFSQIFTLYSDSRKEIAGLLKLKMKGSPIARVKYKDEEHILWRLSDAEAIQKIKRIMQAKKILIADGHHRYEVSRLFYEEMKKKFGPAVFPGSAYTMLYFTNMEEDGLSILPTHRLVKSGRIMPARLERLNKFFKVIFYPYKNKAFLKKAMAGLTSALNENKLSFGFVQTGEMVLKVFILKDKSLIKNFIREKASFYKKNLAVTILDEAVLEGLLGLTNFENNIVYTRDMDEAIKKVEKGIFGQAFFLRATSLKELQRVAGAGERMPHKSTYFYPKLLSGLLIYDQEKSPARRD